MNRLAAAFLKQVGDYMLVETPLARADVCIVFGNPHADHLAARAAELYHQGYFGLIIVSGGMATDDGRLEAHRMRDVLLVKGVPAEKILIEDKSRHTGENVVMSMAVLKEKKISNINSVMAVGHIHASRRFLMTLERHWPQVEKMFTSSSCFSVPKDQWYTDPFFKKAVLHEYKKIPLYKILGFITEGSFGRNPGASYPEPKRKPPTPPAAG